MTPQLILVTGANAAGKTTLIEANRPLLVRAGYNIIIPDDLFRKAHSLYEGNPVTDAINEALIKNENFVLESPYQQQELTGTLKQIKAKGYYATLIQLFLGREENSVLRVKDRANIGGLNIPANEVVMNYHNNMHNVAQNFNLFDKSFFFDNSGGNYENNLLAVFYKRDLQYYRPTENPAINSFFKLALEYKSINKKAATIVTERKTTYIKAGFNTTSEIFKGTSD